VKHGIIIHMGAGKFTADVQTPDGLVSFNINAMTRRQQHEFRVALVAAWREARECN
jgi:hypothetical protein